MPDKGGTLAILDELWVYYGLNSRWYSCNVTKAFIPYWNQTAGGKWLGERRGDPDAALQSRHNICKEYENFSYAATYVFMFIF